MKGGRRRNTPSEAMARRTYRPDRHAGLTELAVPSDPPAMPDYLTPGAQAVWLETLGRVMSAGISEADSSLFARYCSLEAVVRQAFDAGGMPPPAAYLTVLRQHEELLRIAGPRSRVGGAPVGKPSNPFSRNGAQARK